MDIYYEYLYDSIQIEQELFEDIYTREYNNILTEAISIDTP